MSRSKKRGPSNSVLLWTLYALLLVTWMAATSLLVTGDVFTKAGAAALLWRAVRTMRSLTGK
jgi:hypothetical protein